MSRASAAGFADFFPAAPRAAKNKAKERQRAKSKALDSPSATPVNHQQEANTPARSRDENVQSDQAADGSNGANPEPAMPILDNSESPQGDLLNGVGSASSHASTISSVFSAPPATTTFGGPSNLTPLTTADSSPPPLVASPHHSNTATTVSLSRSVPVDITFPEKGVAETQSHLSAQDSPAPRIQARDPNRGVKGEKCTYDPQLDPKLSSSDRKKAKPIYKAFGLVRT
jgi:[histone H3]-lysine4 N-trimethyltransferase SETD1